MQKKIKNQKIAGRTYKPIVIGVVFSILFWIVESVINTIVFYNGSLVDQIFTTNLNEIWTRLIVVCIIIFISIFSQRIITARKHVEEALCENVTMYSSLFHHSNDAILIHNLEGQIIDINENALNQFGYSRSEMVSLKLSDLYPPGKHEILKGNLETFFREGAFNFEVNFKKKNGETFPADVSLSLFEIQGEKVGQSIIRNVTKQKQAEEALRESEEKFLKAFHSSSVLMFICTLEDERRCIEVNESALQTFGYKREEVIGKKVRELDIYPDERQRHEMLKAVQEKGYLKNYEVKLQTKNNEYRYGSISVDIIELQDKPCLLVAMNDITDRKLAEEALRESEEKFSSIIYQASAGFILSDNQGRIIEFNPGAESIFEISCKQALKMKIWDMITKFAVNIPFTNTELKEEYVQQAQKRLEFRLELKIKVKKKIKYIDSRISTVKTKSDNLFLQVIDDITEREQAEEQKQRYAAELERSNQELQQFAYVVSHDLQEPLRMVSSYVQLLAQRYQGRLDADADEFISYAVDGAYRMKALINGLLEYSRVGTHGKDFEPTDCEVILNRTIADLQITIEENKAIVTYTNLPTVMADGTQLSQLFQNLINNAIKFHSEKPPRIHVSVKSKENEWLFSVRDNGIGIEPQYAKRIFEIFQRLHTVREYPGTGIGLAICKKIVERHGGSIRVKSKPRKGSIFYFTIPKMERK